MAVSNFNKLLKQKKARKLFLGMLVPLIFITVVACSFFYYVSNQILQGFMKNQLELSVEKLNYTVTKNMQPIIINIDNFVTFAGDYNDEKLLENLLISFSDKLDKYASMLYFAPA